MRRISIAVLLVLGVYSLRAQLYIQPSVGYMFSTNPDRRITFMTINGIQNSFTSKIRNSEGMAAGMAIGYDVHKHLRLELSLIAQPFSSFTLSTALPETYRSASSYAFSTTIGIGDYTYRNDTYQAAPLVGYRVSQNRLKVSLLAGPSFLTSTMHIKSHTVASLETWKADSTVYSDEKYSYSGSKIGVGFRSSIAIDYKIRKALSLYLNVSSTYTKFKLTSKKIEQYEIGGVDQMNTLSRTTIALPDSDSNKIDFSQIGIMVGVKYMLMNTHD